MDEVVFVELVIFLFPLLQPNIQRHTILKHGNDVDKIFRMADIYRRITRLLLINLTKGAASSATLGNRTEEDNYELCSASVPTDRRSMSGKREKIHS